MKAALDRNADRILGVSPVPITETAPPLAPMTTREAVNLELLPVSRAEEREEWPG